MRSFLFVPADSDRKLAKGTGSGADALILDLEDAVVPANKAAARTTAAEFLANRPTDGRQMLIVRMNALDTAFWEQDLAETVPARPDAILVPKTISGDCIAKVCQQLTRLEKQHGLDAGSTKLMNVATETAASLFNLGTYGGVSNRFFAMTWGAEDLSADLGARTNRDEAGFYTHPYQLARTLCLLGAVAANVMPIDGICKNFRDDKELEEETRAAIRDGFTGKLAIHPAQIPIINTVFTPSDADLAEAHAVIKVFADAGNPGVIALDGKMLDRPHLRQAEQLIARAQTANTQPG